MSDPVKLEHFRNLISLSAADGKIEARERRFLTRIAMILEIPGDRLEVMLAHAHEYVYLVPQNHEDKEKQLKEMIELALIDGDFAKSERQLILSVAKKLGFTEKAAEDLIRTYSAGTG